MQFSFHDCLFERRWSARWLFGGLLGGRLVVCSGTRLQLDGSGGALGGMFCSWVVSRWSPRWCSVLSGQLAPLSIGLLCLACSSASLQLVIKVATWHSAAARRQARGLSCRVCCSAALVAARWCSVVLGVCSLGGGGIARYTLLCFTNSKLGGAGGSSILSARPLVFSAFSQLASSSASLLVVIS
ncbi:unnamed protein product [Calypogeia fissa]